MGRWDGKWGAGGVPVEMKNKEIETSTLWVWQERLGYA